jgi:uncharacterized repeat protein (TIGR02543 family)
MASWSSKSPWSKSWGTEYEGYAQNASYYEFRGLFSYVRGSNNTLYVKCAVQAKLRHSDYKYYPYNVYAEVSVGDTSHYTASSAFHAESGGGLTSTSWQTLGVVYYTGTANSGQTFYMRTSWSGSLHSAALSKLAPGYTSSYTITYNGNGNNSGSTGAQTATYGVATTVSNNGFTKSGYNFVKWNTAQNGSGTDYYPGGSITIYGNTTLYAQWSQITYTVSYNGNGATSGTTAQQTKVWGTPLPLQQNGYSKTNYTFQHWNTAADDSGTSYAAGASYIDNAAVTLYAIWKKNNIPVFIRSGNDIIQVEKAFINDGGTIKECTVYQNLGGTIVEYV